MAAKPGQIALRRFDHDEAVRRYAAGETPAALAREYGVTDTAVRRVVNPKVRAQMQAHSVKWTRNARTACLGGCGRLVWSHGTGSSSEGRTGYCIFCFNENRYVEQHGTETGYVTQRCRCAACREAANEARRQRRERAKVPCSHGCGTLVDPYNARDPGKPPECHPCVLQRQREARAGQ